MGRDRNGGHHAVGEVEIQVPHDRKSTFTPQIVRKRQRRLSDMDDVVLSLYAKGMMTGPLDAVHAAVFIDAVGGPARLGWHEFAEGMLCVTRACVGTPR